MVSFWRWMREVLVRCVVPGIAALVLTAASCAYAQTAASAPPSKSEKLPANAVSSDKTGAAKPSHLEINSKAIVKRVNEEVGLDLNATIANWQSELDHLATDLRQHRVRWSQLDAYREKLQQIKSHATDLSARLQSRLDATKAELRLLGPAPTTEQPLSHQMALNRTRLTYRVGLLSAGKAAASSAVLRVNNLLNKTEDIRRKNFTSLLLEPIPGIYSYETWSQVPEYIPWTVEQVRDLVGNWWLDLQDHGAVARVGIEAAVLFLILSIVGVRGVRGSRRWDDAGEPPFWRRASSAAGVVLFRALPATIPFIFAYRMIAAQQALPFRLNWLFYLTTESIVIVAMVAALVLTVFSPLVARWRLIAVSDRVAARICSLVIVLAFVYSLATLLYAITRLVRAPFALTIAVALPSSLLLVGLVIAILRTPLGNGVSVAPSMRLFRAARSLVWIIVTAIVVCALAGYLPLARFLAQQLIVTGLILALVYLMLLWVDGFAQSISDDGAVAGRWLKERGKLDPGRRENLALPVKALLKVAVLVLAVPFIMLQWGYTWPDIEEWYRQLFFGLHIGNTQVTFGALLASMIVFGVGYAAARLFQGWLDVQVLQPAGISGGVRNSIRTGVGYVGILIAALAAFSYAGFSLSSLAIVAGAFSIGIGFGLQNVVNNFVSGLIMLVERPVRVGDFVVVGDEQGYVRKISVRSTEIETFDRYRVLVPNSSFISEKVKNWTLRNPVGRVTVSVGTAYECSPRKVKDVLLRVARDNPQVLKEPAPLIEVAAFGSSSVDFILNVFVDINDLTTTRRVRTDLSLAIFEAFAEAGITIPFTQTDVKIRNVGEIHDAIVGYASQLGLQSTNGGGKVTDASAAAEER